MKRVGNGRMDGHPIVTIEEATADGHGRECDDKEIGCSLMKKSVRWRSPCFEHGAV